MTIEHAPRLAYTDDSHIELAPRPHVDDIAVDTLAAQQKARMAEKRAQGFNGWDDPRRCSVEKLSMLMAQSMCKGKVVDVANFAAMLHSRGAAPELVGEHAMRSLLRGAREHRTSVASQLRVILADDSYAFTFQTMAQYRTALLKVFDTVATTEEPTPQACTHCGGSGRQEDVFEQAENPVYALGEELVKAQAPDADPRAVDTLIEALDCTLREHGFTVVPAETEQATEQARPTQEIIAEAMAEHCESNGYAVAPEVIESLAKLVAHMDEPAIAAPAAAEAQPADIERALFELVNKIDSELDTGDLLADARRASAALDAIMHGGDLVANAWEFFKTAGPNARRYETSVEFRIGWNACLDAIGEARKQAAHSRQAQGGALSDQQISEIASRHFSYESDMATITAFARAILSRAGSEPRAEERKEARVICIRAKELLDALELAAPDACPDGFDREHEQMDTELCIGRLKGSLDDDGKDTGPGLFAWYSEYPEEGVIPLRLDSEVRAEIDAALAAQKKGA